MAGSGKFTDKILILIGAYLSCRKPCIGVLIRNTEFGSSLSHRLLTPIFPHPAPCLRHNSCKRHRGLPTSGRRGGRRALSTSGPSCSLSRVTALGVSRPPAYCLWKLAADLCSSRGQVPSGAATESNSVAGTEARSHRPPSVMQRRTGLGPWVVGIRGG